MAKIPPIGEDNGNRNDRIKGGESFTVVYTTNGFDLLLKEGDRLRIEYKQNPNKDVLYPHTDTELFKDFPKIDLKQIADHPQDGRTYEFTGSLNGQTKTLYLHEGYAQQLGWPVITPEPEMEIYENNPTQPGGGGGVAGLRR